MRDLSEQGVNRANRFVFHGSGSFFHREKHLSVQLQYACRVTSSLIKIAQFLEILCGLEASFL
jgi:hypothetical protein